MVMCILLCTIANIEIIGVLLVCGAVTIQTLYTYEKINDPTVAEKSLTSPILYIIGQLFFLAYALLFSIFCEISKHVNRIGYQSFEVVGFCYLVTTPVLLQTKFRVRKLPF